jgi:biotin synthase-related radical SAM superfamily protein
MKKEKEKEKEKTAVYPPQCLMLIRVEVPKINLATILDRSQTKLATFQLSTMIRLL